MLTRSWNVKSPPELVYNKQRTTPPDATFWMDPTMNPKPHALAKADVETTTAFPETEVHGIMLKQASLTGRRDHLRVSLG